MTRHSLLTRWLACCLSIVALHAALVQPALAEKPNDGNSQAPLKFLQQHCVACHEGAAAEGAFDATALGDNLSDPAVFARWVRIHDRVRDGEMPPPDADKLSDAEIRRFTSTAGSWLKEHQQREHEQFGRVRGKRLTNLQLERTLHDLLGIDIPLAIRMPEDPRSDGFTTVTEAQQMSHFQMARHIDVVDVALDEAFRRAMGKDDEWTKDFSAKELARTRTRTREPELIDGRIVVWSSRLIFYGRIPRTSAPDDGWYRFHIRGIRSLKSPKEHGVWCTVRSGPCVSSAPLLDWLGSFEATDEPKDVVVEGWLPKRHMLEIRPGDRTLKQASFRGGQAENGEGDAANVPGVSIESIRMERVHRGPSNEAIRNLLLGDLPVEFEKKSDRGKVISKNPREDAVALVTRFAQRAFRRPVDARELDVYRELVVQALDGGADFVEALRIGYRSLLCSPRFLYFYEEPGRLDDYAVASRLSYLLWNSMPDDALLSLAEQGQLHDPKVLRGEVDRMLAGERARTFIEDFAAQWLELSQIDSTEPDTRMHPNFDVIVQYSMLEETHTFLHTLLEKNRSVRELINADFTFLNSRLARYYRIDGVKGDELRRVTLDSDNHRRGLLTHGSVLKVTANGTNTSPILRGVWVCDRILGQPIPPPPQSVAAIEPDIRGAKSIREIVEKHRADAACAVCHVTIDPPGFALENFDAAGRWREHYLVKDGRRVKKGEKIDAGYVLKDGRAFEDIDEMCKLLADDPEPIAGNVAAKLLTYGTGSPVKFADRGVVEQIVKQTADDDYGLRSLVYACVASPIFLSK